MKILYDSRVSSNGIGVYSDTMLNELTKIFGYDSIDILVNNKFDNLNHRQILLNIKLYSLKNFLPNLFGHIENYDYFISPTYSFCNKFRYRKKVHVIHDLAVLADKNYFASPLLRVAGKLYWKTYFYFFRLFVGRIYAISETTASDIFKFWEKSVSGLLPNVVEILSEHKYLKKSNTSKIKILYFGNARSHKNINRILNLAQSYPQYDFCFSGACCDHKNLRIKRSNVILYGFLSQRELYDKVANSDATILLSTYEGFGRGVVESLVLKTPVILNRAGALKEFYDLGILSLEDDSLFDEVIDRAIFVRRHDLINSKYFSSQHSLKNFTYNLKQIFE